MATLSPVRRPPAPLGPRRRGGDAEGRGRRLRERLLEAGPIAARFGIHLGGRVDLLSGTDCLALLEIPDRGEASHPARVAELFQNQLGARPRELFEELEPEPFDSGLVLQWHRARLPGGARAVVELVHPELVAELGDGRLAGLADRLDASGDLPGAAEAIAGFERRLDLRQTALELEELADETEESRWIEVPRSYLRLCARRIRVFADPGGEAEGSPHGDGDGEPASREARARRLARGWLALALGGRLFPTAPWGRDIRHLRSGRVAILGGGTHRLPRTVHPELRDYLAAVAAGKPARAAEAFLDLLPAAVRGRRLRDRLRHTDPFRDRGWDVGGDRFARQVLAHWRTAGGLGHHPPESLVPFYRGTFLLNQETRRLAPHAAPLRDGLREARLLLLFEELREEVESGRWAGAFERGLTVVAGLPQKLDRILTLAAEDDRDGRSGGRLAVEEEDAAVRGSWGAVGACLLGLIAVALVTRHLGDAVALGSWPERLGALVALGLGGLLLRTAARAGGD